MACQKLLVIESNLTGPDFLTIGALIGCFHRLNNGADNFVKLGFIDNFKHPAKQVRGYMSAGHIHAFTKTLITRSQFIDNK